MKDLRFGRYTLCCCVAAALLAGCGALRQAQDDMQPPIGAPDATPQISAISSRSQYKILYSFGAAPDGNYPTASLIDAGGTLYGTTRQGGTYTCYHTTSSYYYAGACGTVFSVTTNGTEKVLHSFGARGDGGSPGASLLDVAGTLYGTTTYGGSNTCGYQSERYGCGTVFSITTGGTENVLHSFSARDKDGVGPDAPLIDVKGTLYGTTDGGGANSCGLYIGGCGTVFSITRVGTESVLRSFKRAAKFPIAGLADARDTLYGTTYEGGANSCGRIYRGCGTVFGIALGGRLQVLHKFGRGTDGHSPRAGLIEVKGTFYGTTAGGGAHDDGAVFSISSAGAEKVLYSFAGGTDGSGPAASLIDVHGTLYGTTSRGGGGSCGCGTAFSITPGGTETVLHSFGGSPSDGADPESSLINVNGTLYGTTYQGGTYGFGTVFALTL